MRQTYLHVVLSICCIYSSPDNEFIMVYLLGMQKKEVRIWIENISEIPN